uniref:Uncharacterized protein n=1 Tax=Cucumis sativus TaxID=3659 RepID=A0A0A0LM17_CUCSA
MHQSNNSNQNSIGEQEVVFVDSDIQKGLRALEKYVQANGLIPIKIELKDRKPICKDSSKSNSQIGKENYFILDLDDPLVQDYLDHEMSVLYRDFHCSLHKSYKKCDSPTEARKHCDKRVAQDSDWARLCDRWEREGFKSRSEANTKARSKLPFTHRGGTVTFLRHKQKMV